MKFVAAAPPVDQPGGRATKFVAAPPPVVHPGAKPTKFVAAPPPTVYPGGTAMKFVPAPPPTVQPVGSATKFVAAPPPTENPEYLFGKLIRPVVRSIDTANAAAVVKDQVKVAASGLPPRSFAAVVIVAVYCVPAARLAEGVNVAVLPATATVPATLVPPVVVFTVKLVVFSVE